MQASTDNEEWIVNYVIYKDGVKTRVLSAPEVLEVQKEYDKALRSLLSQSEIDSTKISFDSLQRMTFMRP